MASSEQAIPKIWHEASCHCGAVSFEVLHEPLYAIPEKSFHAPVACDNCSICLKNGYLLVYPLRDEIKWHSGWDKLKNYRMASKTKDHKFCGECGSSICIDMLGDEAVGKFLNKPGTDFLAVNVRMFKDMDVDKLNLNKMNGKAYNPQPA